MFEALRNSGSNRLKPVTSHPGIKFGATNDVGTSYIYIYIYIYIKSAIFGCFSKIAPH